MKEYELIVPSHYVDWTYFTENVKSWLEYLPISKIYFGNNNPDKKVYKDIKEYLEGFPKIEFIDQRGMKTLGMQIADLMKRVQGGVFIYCHGDVRIVEHSMLVMEATLKEDVGIVESERVQYDYDNPKSYPTVYPHYAFRERSFSGFQLIRVEAIKVVLDTIEDDYIYRNEDVIFQNACINAGFTYEKALSALHIHTCSNVNHKWTPQGEFTNERDTKTKTFKMQIRGIVKYCTPDHLTKVAWRDAFGVCLSRGEDLSVFIKEFVRDVNPQWENAIWDIIEELLKGIYR